MQKREIAALACQILGLYALLGALQPFGIFLGELLRLFRNNDFPTVTSTGIDLISPALSRLVPFILQLMAGAFLWLSARGLAMLMVREDGEVSLAPKFEIQAVAFPILGAWSLLQSLSQVGRAVVVLIESARDTTFRTDWTPVSAPALLALAVQIALGFYLLLGASGLSDWLQFVAVKRRKNH